MFKYLVHCAQGSPCDAVFHAVGPASPLPDSGTVLVNYLEQILIRDFGYFKMMFMTQLSLTPSTNNTGRFIFTIT